MSIQAWPLGDALVNHRAQVQCVLAAERGNLCCTERIGKRMAGSHGSDRLG
jgi:hypothetical protein